MLPQKSDAGKSMRALLYSCVLLQHGKDRGKHRDFCRDFIAYEHHIMNGVGSSGISL